MTIEQLIKKMKAIETEYGTNYEAIHSKQDDALLEYINNARVTRVFRQTPKWCG